MFGLRSNLPPRIGRSQVLCHRKQPPGIEQRALPQIRLYTGCFGAMASQIGLALSGKPFRPKTASAPNPRRPRSMTPRVGLCSRGDLSEGPSATRCALAPSETPRTKSKRTRWRDMGVVQPGITVLLARAHDPRRGSGQHGRTSRSLPTAMIASRYGKACLMEKSRSTGTILPLRKIKSAGAKTASERANSTSWPAHAAHPHKQKKKTQRSWQLFPTDTLKFDRILLSLRCDARAKNGFILDGAKRAVQ